MASMSAATSAGSSRPKVNLRSTAVKRIMQEANELSDPSEEDFVAAPLETDIFEWHCTMRGVADSEYDGGLYHLRILLPPSYPMSAPDIILLTPNGRFELGKKICIDGLTSFHAGSWQPAWGVRTAILGLRSFWMQSGEALSAIGALDCSKEERKRLAKLSKEWKCPTCDCRNGELLPDHIPRSGGESSQEASGQSVVPNSETALLAPDVGPAPTPLSPAEEGQTSASSDDAGSSVRQTVSATSRSKASTRPIPPPILSTSPADASPVRGTAAATFPSVPQTEPTSLPEPSPHYPTLPPPASRPLPTAPPETVPIHTLPTPSHVPVPVPPFARDPIPVAPRLSPNRRGVPLWLDALICACFSMLVLLVARKAVLGGGRDEGSLFLRDDL